MSRSLLDLDPLGLGLILVLMVTEQDREVTLEEINELEAAVNTYERSLEAAFQSGWMLDSKILMQRWTL